MQQQAFVPCDPAFQNIDELHIQQIRRDIRGLGNPTLTTVKCSEYLAAVPYGPTVTTVNKARRIETRRNARQISVLPRHPAVARLHDRCPGANQPTMSRINKIPAQQKMSGRRNLTLPMRTAITRGKNDATLAADPAVLIIGKHQTHQPRIGCRVVEKDLAPAKSGVFGL